MERYIDDVIHMLGDKRNQLQYMTDAEITRILGGRNYCAQFLLMPEKLNNLVIKNKRVILYALNSYLKSRKFVTAVIIVVSLLLEPYIGLAYYVITNALKYFLRKNNCLVDVFTKNNIVISPDMQY